MSKKLFNGPLLFIILGGLLVLAYRYLPFESLLEKIKAGRGDAQVTERTAPPVAKPGPVDNMPVPVAPAAPGSAPPLPDSVPESTAVTTMPTAIPGPPAVAVPEVRSPPPPAEPPTTVAVAGRSEPIPEPVLPNLRVFVQADVHERAGLGDLGADRYAEQLKVELAAVAGDYLGREAVQGEDPNMKFRDYLAEGREGLEQICMLAQAQRVLLADVEISAAGFSNVDSAYWPEVSYIAINCGDGRVHKSPKKRLEPHRLDTFEFQQQFSRRSQEFIASQGYFLKP